MTAPLPHHPLRVHQAQVAGLVDAIATGELTGVRDILAAVTPGGGKSLVLVIAVARLIGAGTIERVVWVVPRDSLRLQKDSAMSARWTTRHLSTKDSHVGFDHQTSAR